MLQAVFVLTFLLGATAAVPTKHAFTLLSEYHRHDIRVTSLCVEGHVVLVAHSDVGKGGGLQMVQVQHLVDGAIVPMQCDPASGPADPDASDKGKDAGKD